MLRNAELTWLMARLYQLIIAGCLQLPTSQVRRTQNPDRILIGKLDNFLHQLIFIDFYFVSEEGPRHIVVATILAMLLRVTHPSDTIHNKSQEKLSET